MEPQADGQPLRAHLEAAERQTGRRPAALDVEPIPDCFERQVGLWVRLADWRPEGMTGPGVFSWRDLEAFATVAREQLSGVDLTIIRVVEDEWQSVVNGFRAKARDKEGPARHGGNNPARHRR